MKFYDYPCCEICGIKTLYTCAGCYAVLDYVNQENHCPEKSGKVGYPVLCGICDSDFDFPTKVQLRNKRKIKANLEWNETYNQTWNLIKLGHITPKARKLRGCTHNHPDG